MRGIAPLIGESMGRNKKNNLENVKAKILHDDQGKEHVMIYEDKKVYAFRNMLPGPFFFIRTDGSDCKIDGYGLIEDIDEKEYKRFKKSLSYEMGEIVEENVDELESNSYNTLNDKQIEKLFKQHNSDQVFMKDWIQKMTSLFALTRMKNYIIENNYSAVLSSYCESRVVELNSEIEEEKKEPIDTAPRGVIV